jgi:hypothetical protein
MCPQQAPPGEPPRPEGTPEDVIITWEARRPVSDPTLGEVVGEGLATVGGGSKHRLVAIGDSITHGFQSLAISKTSLSFPALVARELGWFEHFRYPTYEGYGGLPLNLEVIVRHLEDEFGTLNLLEALPAAVWLAHWAHNVEHWWVVDADRSYRPRPGRNHNLGVYSYDVADTWTRTRQVVEDSIASPDHSLLSHFKVTADVDRAARRVLADADPGMAVLDVAAAHGEDGGIETLLVALGANNALDVVIGLDLIWSGGDPALGAPTVYRPIDFAADWAKLVVRLKQITAEHVVVATVPHVTIAPLFSGTGGRQRPDSRFFNYYTHAWLADRFNPGRDRYVTADQARAVDSAIDQYNDTIAASVAAARKEGRDWYLFELGGLLDRLAYRRYLSRLGGSEDDRKGLPTWWDEAGGAYPLPEPLPTLPDGPPDSRFFLSGPDGRTQGGLFALDGVHPTTIGYGIVAQEVIRVMEKAGVVFRDPDGNARPQPVDIAFDQLVTADSLISNPPRTLAGDVRIVGWLNDQVDLVGSLLGHRGWI